MFLQRIASTIANSEKRYRMNPKKTYTNKCLDVLFTIVVVLESFIIIM